jgi:hypothetical protein
LSSKKRVYPVITKEEGMQNKHPLESEVSRVYTRWCLVVNDEELDRSKGHDEATLRVSRFKSRVERHDQYSSGNKTRAFEALSSKGSTSQFSASAED